MRLSQLELEKATDHRINYGPCLLCGSMNMKVAPVLIDMLVQGSKLIDNDYMLFSMIAVQCEVCKRIEYFNKNILNLEVPSERREDIGDIRRDDNTSEEESGSEES